MSPLTREQEARIREIVREELERVDGIAKEGDIIAVVRFSSAVEGEDA